MVGSDGGVFTFGDARFEGSCPGIGGCSGAAVAVMPDASGKGYWVVTQTGHVYSFGDATYYGAPGPQASPVTAASAHAERGRLPDPLGQRDRLRVRQWRGAWGAGRAHRVRTGHGHLHHRRWRGYWVATANGGVYTYGDAPYDGSMAGTRLNGSIIAGTGW